MPGMAGFQSMVMDYYILSQMSILIAAAGPDIVFLVDWLLVWQIFCLWLSKNIRSIFLPPGRVISISA